MDYSGSNQPEGGSSASGTDDFKYQYKDQGGPGTAPPQAPPPPPPPKAKSFNWLACCGISCAVVVVLGLIAGVILWKFAQGAMDSFQPMIEAGEQIEQTDLATIQAQATEVTALRLAANPTAFTGGWLELKGAIIPDPDGGSQYPGEEEGTAYFLEGNIMVVDYTGVSRVGSAGDTIRCWGKAVVFDMTSIPLVGGLLEQAMKEDPNTPDLSSLVLFMAKSVELVEPAPSKDTAPPADPVDNPCGDTSERTQDDGWL